MISTLKRRFVSQRLLKAVLLSTAFGLSVVVSFAQSSTKSYRNRVAAARGGGRYAYDSTPRYISTFFRITNTNGLTVVSVPSTTSVSTNLPGASITDTSTNYSLQATNVVSMTTLVAGTNIPIRSLTVTVVFQARFPLGNGGNNGLIFSLQRGTDTPVNILQTGPAAVAPLYIPGLASGYVHHITVDAASLLDIREDPGLATNQAGVTGTFKPVTTSVFNNFTNLESGTTWTLQLDNQTGSAAAWLLGFTVNITSDTSTLTVTQADGSTVSFDTTPRYNATFEGNKSGFLPRFITEL